jgi:mRNA-degrading endonuclease toxin of MazEF toxin-antitoxin module
VKDQFEVWRCSFPQKGGEHPVVLNSHPDICARAAVVNVLFCTSQRQSRRCYPHEVLLNGEDGMDWETFCDCSCLYAVNSADLFGKRGHVTLERRRQIRAKIRDIFLLSTTD